MKIAFVFNRKTDQSLDQAEFDTPQTIDAIHSALAHAGHEVVDIEMTLGKGHFGWVRNLAIAAPDLVFNTAEGHYGVARESLGPTVFEQLQLPYVGSGPYGCFLTLDKFLTKQMVALRGVPVVEGYFVNTVEELSSIAKEAVYPAFVKPNYEGSSKGITENSVCHNSKELLRYGTELLQMFAQGILVEKFILGRDVAVPFIAGLGDGGVLEPIEYVFNSADRRTDNVYDYDLKNVLDAEVSVHCPAALDSSVRLELIRLMKRVVPVVGVVDFARADFRITPDGEIFFLELNALPSLQPGAGIFESTKLLGLDYTQTILAIVDAARSRLKLKGPVVRAPKRLLTTKTARVGLVYNLKRKIPTDRDYELEAEYDSQSTVDAIVSSITKLGMQVVPIEATRVLAQDLQEFDIDVVFNIAEGNKKRAREAQVPAICDLLGIEHTGSDATCLAITLDKAITKRLLAQDGIVTPNFKLYQGGKVQSSGLRFPVIVKPNHEGTSKGINGHSVVNNDVDLSKLVTALWERFQDPVLCEEYIEGREYTVGVLGTSTLKTLGPMEIVFTESAGRYPVYSFEAKTGPADGNPIFSIVCPATLTPEVDRRVTTVVKKAFRSLGCRDVARVDLKINAKGEVYFLEINPLPGLTPGFSDLVIMAERCNVSYDSLIKRILMPAIQRWRSIGKI